MTCSSLATAAWRSRFVKPLLPSASGSRWPGRLLAQWPWLLPATV
jgi:hypothetical protein